MPSTTTPDRDPCASLRAAPQQRVDEPPGAPAQVHETLARIVADSPIPTFVIDTAHRVTLWNQACERISGVPAAAVVGGCEAWRAFYPSARPVLAELVMDGDRDRINTLYGAKAQPVPGVPGAFEAEDFFPQVGNAGRWLFFTAAPMRDADGRVIGAIETLQDVSARKQAEIELHEARAVAEAAARVKAEFLANMSHEFRTPLNAIVGLARLLDKGELAPRQREQLGRIRSAGEMLRQLVDDVLDFSRIEAGRMPIEHAAFVLDSLLDTLSSLVADGAREKGLELHFVVADDVPQHLVGDSPRLLQVLVNLVGNAIKFTEAGQVLIFVSVTSRDGDTVHLEIAVQDTGIGIAEAQQARLFRAFSPVDASTTRKQGGSGLGLAISQRLVGLMGGRITLASTPGVGSTFLFQLPLLTGAGDAAPARIGAGCRALVVDDNAVARTVLSRLLTNLGYRVDTVASGAAALAGLTAAGDDPYHLLFLDWNMPDMNGVEVARRVRAGVVPPPRIVVVTSAGQREAESAFAESEVEGLVQKPISASSLAAALAGLDAAPPSALPAAPAARRLAGLRILVVDDVPTNRQIVCELLEDEGARVAEAENGRQALQRLGDGADWDIVLMDVQMPEMDGLEATRRLRAEPRSCRLPVVAMTAFALAEEKARCLAAGMTAFLTKPIDAETVVATLAGLAPGSEAQRPTPAAATAPPSFPSLPGIDTAGGLRRMMNKADFYERILKSFYDRFAPAPATVRAHLAAGNADEARREAHSAKGVAASIGAEGVRAAARALEQAIAGGRRDVDGEIDAFAAALEEVFTGLRAQFGWAAMRQAPTAAAQ